MLHKEIRCFQIFLIERAKQVNRGEYSLIEGRMSEVVDGGTLGFSSAGDLSEPKDQAR